MKVSNSILEKIVQDAYDVLIGDETLLRLLHYPPKDLRTGQPDPLSNELPNIIVSDNNDIDGIENMWNVIDRHVLDSSKSDDLEVNELCRIYVYLGRSRTYPRNSLVARQEIVFDVLCHNRYDKDSRIETISDRITKLIFNKRLSGIGKVKYKDSYNINAPKEYQAVRHLYETARAKG